MHKELRLMTDENLVREFISNDGIYIPGVLEEICKRAGMQKEWDDADGETFERVAQIAAQELCPHLCRA